MLNQFVIYIRNKNGTFTSRFHDITSAKILEKLNDVGSWSISSTTPENCPFSAGDGIVIFKKDIVYYSGLLSKISSDYDGYNKLYKWSASGGNDLSYLSQRLCHPDPINLTTTSEGHYEDSGPLGDVVKRLIDRNVGVNAPVSRRNPILDETIVVNSGTLVSVSLRFDKLLGTVTSLLNEQNFVIMPIWNQNTKKLHYEISAGKDATDKLVFSTSLNQIERLKYSLSAPTGNYVISAGQGEMTERNFAYAQNPDSISDWGRIEAYHDMRSVNDSDLQADADAFLENSEVNEGYSAELSPETADGYKRVWDIGDDVGIVVDNKIFRSRLLQVETSIDYDSESISPTVGTLDTGQLNPIFRDIKGLRSDVDQLLKINN